MSRIDSMSRFQLPDDIVHKALCAACGTELYEGETIYELHGTYICYEESCLATYVEAKIVDF